MMSECRLCGGRIIYARSSDGRLTLDGNEQYSGPDRYVIIDYTSDPWAASPVQAGPDTPAYPLHETVCSQRA